jgi:hypothetical protein
MTTLIDDLDIEIKRQYEEIVELRAQRDETRKLLIDLTLLVTGCTDGEGYKAFMDQINIIAQAAKRWENEK